MCVSLCRNRSGSSNAGETACSSRSKVRKGTWIRISTDNRWMLRQLDHKEMAILAIRIASRSWETELLEDRTRKTHEQLREEVGGNSTGLELQSQLGRSISPNLPLLVSSGYALPTTDWGSGIRNIHQFLHAGFRCFSAYQTLRELSPTNQPKSNLDHATTDAAPALP